MQVAHPEDKAQPESNPSAMGGSSRMGRRDQR